MIQKRFIEDLVQFQKIQKINLNQIGIINQNFNIYSNKNRIKMKSSEKLTGVKLNISIIFIILENYKFTKCMQIF